MLAAITVTHHPDLALLRAQRQSLPADCLWVLVDNASPPEACAALRALLTELPGPQTPGPQTPGIQIPGIQIPGDQTPGIQTPPVQLICNRENLGLAAALNQGVASAAAAGAGWVLLLDQDSLPKPGSVSRLLSAWNTLMAAGEPVGAVGPALWDPVTGMWHGFHQPQGWRWSRVFPAPDASPVSCANLNGSGTLMSVARFQAAGGLAESFFIDHVDTEWAFRLQAQGYRLFGVPAAVFEHRMGVASRRIWLGGWRLWPVRTARRHRFLFRNAVRLLRCEYVPLVWKVWAVPKLLLTIAVTLAIDSQRWQQLRAMVLGVVDGLRSARLQATTRNPDLPAARRHDRA